MNKVRRLLNDILERSLNTEQINYLGRELDPAFSVAKVSGFGEKIVIPRKVAADCITDYFSTDDRLMQFIAHMIAKQGATASGGIIQIKGTESLVSLLKEKNWVFDPEKQIFHRDQSSMRTADWGFMQEGQEYTYNFSSIDIVASSTLIKTNIKEDVDTTMNRLRKFIEGMVEDRNGRMWNWYGDGGLAVFQGDDANTDSAISMIKILAFLPVFNISRNELRPESDIRLRIGMHTGQAIYRADKSKVISPDLKMAMSVEKDCARPNSLALTERVRHALRDQVRQELTQSTDYEGSKIYLYVPR